MECSVNINYSLLVDGSVELLYVLANFLSSYSINCGQKGVEVSNSVNLTSFPFSLYQFLLHIFCTSIVWYKHILYDYFVEGGVDCYNHIMSFSVSGNFLCSEVYFV